MVWASSIVFDIITSNPFDEVVVIWSAFKVICLWPEFILWRYRNSDVKGKFYGKAWCLLLISKNKHGTEGKVISIGIVNITRKENSKVVKDWVPIWNQRCWWNRIKKSQTWHYNFYSFEMDIPSACKVPTWPLISIFPLCRLPCTWWYTVGSLSY